MIKGSIHQEDIKVINIYVPNLRASKYIKKNFTDLKGKIDSNTTIVGDINTRPLLMNRTTRQMINLEIPDLQNSIRQSSLTGMYRTLHPTAEYTFYSTVHGTFSRRDYILVLKTSCKKLEKIEIIQILCFNDHGMKAEFNSRRITRKSRNMWKLNNILLSNQ